ncbi:unknown protein [Seminavis robusta]|uniref:Uncharacterized protein n=1 Tax=Seminavis robusta TaxID=568900 RepID=A0A9N8HJ06_9STRA|nr:unknown protein [Seminavis robusta]|eukprot:Sro660_g182970.1 n/a (621) ;mRNA; f:18530-20675
MEHSVAQMDDEEELMDIVAARSRGDNIEAELRKLEMLKLEAQPREDEQSRRAEIGRPSQPSQHQTSTTGGNSMGEEIKEEEKEEDVFILKGVEDQTKTHRQVEAGLEDELAFPQPNLTSSGQNQSDTATMHPGAYAMAPGNARNQSASDDQSTTPMDTNSGLAVANKVEEDEEPTQIARPDHLHGENGSTSITLMILVLIGSLLMVGVIVGSICGAGLCSNKTRDAETQAPSSFRYFRIEEAFGLGYFPKRDKAEPTQPNLRALDWIVFEDPLQLEPDANNLLQVTYFHTSQQSDWFDCGPSTTANDDTCWIQIQGSESLASRWLAGVHECRWAGIYCDSEKNITQLRLGDNGLNGVLPKEIASLPALEAINFRGNQLTGSIPVELFGNKLSSLTFTNNSLTGTVPTEVGLFDGTSLGFGSNSLSGSLPTELFQIGRGGTLPTEIGALHSRQLFVYLQGNPLHGTIPSEIGLLKGSLRELDVSWTHMDGSLPEELFTACTNLGLLQVSNCGDLTGTIGAGLQLLTKLEFFDISNNKFHGTIPEDLSALTSLLWFLVNGNDLSGSIPSSVCALADPGKERYHFAVAADCLPARDGTGNPMVECSCCTLCCDGGAADYCLSK